MARLTREEIPRTRKHPITSVNLTIELVDQLDVEMARLGIRSRSEMIRLILEKYFKEE